MTSCSAMQVPDTSLRADTPLEALGNARACAVQILWALCVYVEAVSVLPQLRMMQKAKVVEKFTAHYVFALGLSRFISCAHWILQLVDGDSFLLQVRKNVPHAVDSACQTLLPPGTSGSSAKHSSTLGFAADAKLVCRDAMSGCVLQWSGMSCCLSCCFCSSMPWRFTTQTCQEF